MSEFTRKFELNHTGVIAQEITSVLPEIVDLYDDGPIDINYVPEEYRTFNKVSWYRLKQMIERWPAMRKSWESFIVDYHMCDATLRSEELNDDIPF